MKKALVIALTLVLGLGALVFADGLSGTWDTDISIYPAATVFGDFITSFTSQVDVEYSVGGFVFGVESTFGLAGLTGMDFNVDGVLGAFTLEADIDFSPMVLTSQTIEYVDILYHADSCIGDDYPGWTFDTVLSDEVYTAGFDDMFVNTSVSIAGVSLEAMFYLEGDGNIANTTYSTYYTSGTPVFGANDTFVQTAGYTVVDTSAFGSGWKLTASGSFGGATLTARTYFNVKDTFGGLNGLLGYLGLATPVSNTFAESGYWSLVCGDCISRFTGLQVIVEDVSFACTDVSAGVAFDCCGFKWAKFLIEDIALGCCWDLNFDMLISFTALTKTVCLTPDITVANSCFTLDAGIVFTDYVFTGIELYAVGLEYSWNGITFSSMTSFDLSVHPIHGSAKYGGLVYGPNYVSIWVPDTSMTDVTFTYDAAAGTCTASGIDYAVETDGLGYYELLGVACAYHKAWEMFSIEVDGDSCCGGLFDVSAAFYFGDVYELTDLDVWYWYDIATTAGVAQAGTSILIYGDGTTAETRFAAATDNDDWEASAPGCDCCPCEEGSCSFDIDYVEIADTYTKAAANRLFDWLQTDVDVELGLASNFDLTFGLSVSLWGWEDFTFGFEFTF